MQLDHGSFRHICYCYLHKVQAAATCMSLCIVTGYTSLSRTLCILSMQKKSIVGCCHGCVMHTVAYAPSTSRHISCAVCLSVRPSVRPSVRRLSVCLSVCLSVLLVAFIAVVRLTNWRVQMPHIHWRHSLTPCQDSNWQASSDVLCQSAIHTIQLPAVMQNSTCSAQLPALYRDSSMCCYWAYSKRTCTD